MVCRISSKSKPSESAFPQRKSPRFRTRRSARNRSHDSITGLRNPGESKIFGRLLGLILSIALIIQPLVLRASTITLEESQSDQRIPTLVVVPLNVAGTIPRAQVAQFERVLMASLRSENYQIVPLEKISSKSKKKKFCRTLECATKQAKSHGAPVVLVSKILTQDRNYEVRLELYESSTKKVLGTSVESCDLCGFGEVRDVVSVRASVIKAKIDNLALQSANLTVRSIPDEVQISIDGDPLGVTPLQQFVKPGEHILRASKDGYVSESKAIHVIRGVREILDFQLKKNAISASPPPVVKQPTFDRDPGSRSLISMEGWGWISLAAGLGGGAAGGTFLAIHNRPYQKDCSGKNVDSNGTCRYRYDTKLAGTIFAAFGGALLITSIALLIKSRNKKKRKEKALQTIFRSPSSIPF